MEAEARQSEERDDVRAQRGLDRYMNLISQKEQPVDWVGMVGPKSGWRRNPVHRPGKVSLTQIRHAKTAPSACNRMEDRMIAAIDASRRPKLPRFSLADRLNARSKAALAAA